MILPRFQEVYKVSTGRNKDYRFTTDSGVVYVMYAVTGKEFIPNFIFSRNIVYVGFRALNEINVPSSVKIKNMYDKRIMNTVFNFIFDILEDRNAIIAFNYSKNDSSRIIKNRLFNIFYIRHSRNRLHKINFELEGVGTVPIIFRKDNNYFSDISKITSADIIRNLLLKQKRL